MWGALGAAAITSAGALYANQRNIQNQNKMFAEQINLANSAHQREVSDLRLAGLNPILSAQGSGADTPSASLANQENPFSSFADLVQLENQTTAASAQKIAAEASDKNAEASQWQIYDARTLGYAGFDVGIGKRFLGLGGNGKYERVYSIRVNKVTGKAYTIPDNKPISSWTPVEHSKVNTGKVTAGDVPPPVGEPLVIDIHKTADGSKTFEQDNPHFARRPRPWTRKHRYVPSVPKKGER